MQITIDLPEDIEQYLIREAANANVSPQTIILQALRQLTLKPQKPNSQWPEIILSHQGFPDFPAFESYRDELSDYVEISAQIYADQQLDEIFARAKQNWQG